MLSKYMVEKSLRELNLSLGEQMYSFKARPDSYSYNAKTTALLLINFQKEFFSSKGMFADLGFPIRSAKRIATNASKVLKAFRLLNCHIIHVHTSYAPDLGNCSPVLFQQSGRKIGESGPYGRRMIFGEKSTKSLSLVKPKSGESIIHKHSLSAFLHTDLESLLREKNINSLIIAGVFAHTDILSTVMDAYSLGLSSCVLGDLLGNSQRGFQSEFKKRWTYSWPRASSLSNSKWILESFAGLNV